MKHWILVVLIAVGLQGLFPASAPGGQTRSATPFNPPRTADGKPNLQGYWNNQAGSAPWDIEPHAASFQIPAGTGIIVDPTDKKIPYQPAALQRRNRLRDNQAYDDPQAHCAPS